ncbi:MAG: hypothetical protein F4123_09865 [Gemmatimonadetes bacterium]|nr:hypothetical protein [Gemmatimonadota bacterium]MYB99220.1 hypothetical protein [Gemmatimonadota bacterium]MYI46663.1 hypothetical protein [Gemmatimonadota bacterium]
MFDLEKAVRRWRGSLERRSSLSPRELDELEDHLRARVNLELELNAALTPARAFAAAREELGEAATMSSEFAKAGKPRWRGLLVAGWALFGVSFLLPALSVPGNGLGLSRPVGLQPYYGYEVFRELLLADGELANLLAAMVPNLAMLLTLPSLLRARGGQGRWVLRTLAVVGAVTMAIGVLMPPMSVSVPGQPTFVQHPGIGFWAWSLSFVCAATAIWLRNRQWTSVGAERSTA